MAKVLINDGIHPAGKKLLEEANFDLEMQKVPQDQLLEKLPAYDAITVRSATKIRKEVIDQCPNLKVIARGGVGLDNIDVDYARSKGVQVHNTPKASSQSVAELVVGHLFTLARFLHRSNREMPQQIGESFKPLKKQYSKGIQLRGKTLGIIGFGRIGQEVARLAYGLGMQVIAADLADISLGIELDIPNKKSVVIPTQTVGMQQVLEQSDFITVHVPSTKSPIIGASEIKQMKKQPFLINTARGGSVDEAALLEALDNETITAAALDVFESEPTPNEALLNHPKISVSPHIGASTVEAQRNIGLELADILINYFK